MSGFRFSNQINMQYVKRTLLLFILLLSIGEIDARECYPLNDGWRFHFSYENNADQGSYITLPHTWNGDAVAGIYPYMRQEGIYSRTLYIPEKWEGKRLFLRFEGAESHADLFINGCFAGSHHGGGVAFCFEIGEFVRLGEENEIVVTVNNYPSNDLLPISSEKNCYGGITRPVELLVTDPIAISPLYYGSDGLFVTTTLLDTEQAEGEVALHLSCPKPQAMEVTLQAYSPQGELSFTQRRMLKSSFDFNQPLRIPFYIANPHPWHPDHPQCYRFEASIRAGEMQDSISVKAGLRTITLSAEEGFCLNGERIPIRGVALGYDHPHEGPCLSQQSIDQEIALAIEVGANTLLSPEAPHDQRLYERCDELGLLARIDLPFVRTRFLSDRFYSASGAFEEQGVELLREIIAQHYNHPSVILWGISRDVKGLDPRLEPYLKRLHHEAHSFDPTRPTVATSDQDGPINFIPQGIIWHQRLGWRRGNAEDIGLWLNQMGERWSHLASAIHYGAEGFIAQQPDRYNRPTEEGGDLPERRQSRFHEAYLRQLAGDSLLWGVWIETLSDYGSARRLGGINGSGLVSFDRQERKDAFYLYRARWNQTIQTLHIADKRWRERPDEPQQLTVYASNGIDSLILLHNNDTVRMHYYAPNIFRSEEFLLDQENQLVVLGGGLSDTIEIKCGCALKAPVKRAPLQTINRLLIN